MRLAGEQRRRTGAGRCRLEQRPREKFDAVGYHPYTYPALPQEDTGGASDAPFVEVTPQLHDRADFIPKQPALEAYERAMRRR